MGCKADGAAQGYTVLGGIVLLYYAIQRIVSGLNTPYDIVGLFLGIAIIIMVVLAFDASGFVNWKVRRSGALLALFGFFIILIVSGLNLDILSWITRLDTLAGFMILLAGLLTLWSK
jgi:hypothetical protein